MKRRRTGVGPGDTGHLQANVRSSARRRPPRGEVARDSESSRRDLSGNAPGNHRNTCKYHTKNLHTRPLQSHVRAINPHTAVCGGRSDSAILLYSRSERSRSSPPKAQGLSEDQPHSVRGKANFVFEEQRIANSCCRTFCEEVSHHDSITADIKQPRRLGDPLP